MTLERFAVRACLTLVVMATSAVFLPFMLILKLAEGVWLGFSLTASSIRQVWEARGIPELDNQYGKWMEKRPKD